MRKTILGIAALAVIATPLALASAGNAYTADAAGKGFVGKGEVQSAFSWTNAKMQTNHTSITFKTQQDAEQALSATATEFATQDGTQSAVQYGVELGKQSAEQVMTETLSCEKTNGQVEQRFRTGVRAGERNAERIGTAMGTRDAEREGTRTGSREGTRAGSLVGSLTADLNIENKKTGQYTGWFLKGYKAGDPRFTGTGSEQFGAAQYTGDYGFGDWSFGAYEFQPYEFQPYVWVGDFNFGATTWATEDFTADEPNEDPNGVCKVGANNVVNVTRTITPGAVTVSDDVTVLATLDGNLVPDENVTPGDVHVTGESFGTTVPGAVTSTGIRSLIATFGTSTEGAHPGPLIHRGPSPFMEGREGPGTT